MCARAVARGRRGEVSLLSERLYTLQVLGCGSVCASRLLLPLPTLAPVDGHPHRLRPTDSRFTIPLQNGVLTSDGSYTTLAASTVLDGYLGHHVHENAGGSFGGEDFYYGATKETVSPRSHACV